MKNDFVLFPDSDSGDSGADADIALITAYLSRELSAVQVAAVEERLESDAAFRENVRPVIELWTVRGSFAAGAMAGDTSEPAVLATSSLTPADIERGWQRYLGDADAIPLAPLRIETGRTEAMHPTRNRKVSMTRAAAIIAFIVLPLIGFTQLVVYAANNVDAPGHEFARAIVTPVLRPSDTPKPPALPRPRTPNIPQGVPTVDLTTPAAKTTQIFRGVVGIKETSDGVLVNDAVMKRIYLLDSSLAVASIPLDSVPGSAQSYGWNNNSARVPLHSWKGDSALIAQAGAPILRVLDGRGRVVRALDAPVGIMDASRQNGRAFDPLGRALVAIPPENRIATTQLVTLPASAFLPAPRTSRPDGGTGRSGSSVDDGSRQVRISTRPDSIAIVRIDLEARRTDTVAYYGLPLTNPGRTGGYGGGRLVIGYSADGKPESVRQVINPLEPSDAWAVLSDGTIAIVRAHDYHVDWIRPDGTRSSSPKIPYEVKAVTEAEKQRMVDSTRACLDSADAWGPAEAAARRTAIANGGAAARTVATGPDIAPRPACLPPLRRDASGEPQPEIWVPRSIRYEIVPLAEIPDYYPPFRQGAALGDADGNVWILPRITKLSRRGELVYDVVNPTSGLVRRVRLPEGRSIAGFGQGAVYLQYGTLADGFVLERYALPK